MMVLLTPDCGVKHDIIGQLHAGCRKLKPVRKKDKNLFPNLVFEEIPPNTPLPVHILCCTEAVPFQVPFHLCKCDTSPSHNELEMEAVFHIIPKSIQLSHPIMQIWCSLKRIRSPNHMPEPCKRYNYLLCMHCTRLMVIRY